MEEYKDLIAIAQKFGPYQFVIIQLQLVNVITALSCFKHINKLSEQFTQIIQNILKQMQDIQYKYDCMLKILQETKKSGGVDDSTCDNTLGNDNRNVSLAHEDKKRSKHDRQGK